MFVVCIMYLIFPENIKKYGKLITLYTEDGHRFFKRTNFFQTTKIFFKHTSLQNLKKAIVLFERSLS